MPFVKRDQAGTITAIFNQPMTDGMDELAADDPELLAFLNSDGGNRGPDAKLDLSESDIGMVRVLEDLINLLIDKGVIRITDLPEAAQQKLLERGALRSKFGYLGTLFASDAEDEETIAPDAKDFM